MKKPNFAAMNPVVAEAIKQMMAEQGDKFSLEKINLADLGRRTGVDFAATSPTARGKKSTFTGKEAHSHGHEVHREQRGFCPSAP